MTAGPLSECVDGNEDFVNRTMEVSDEERGGCPGSWRGVVHVTVEREKRKGGAERKLLCSVLTTSICSFAVSPLQAYKGFAILPSFDRRQEGSARSINAPTHAFLACLSCSRTPVDISNIPLERLPAEKVFEYFVG